MKYADIEKTYTQLHEFGNLKLPRKIQVAIARNINILEPIMNEIKAQVRDITLKYGKLNDDGKLDVEQVDGKTLIHFKDTESTKLYMEEYNELMAVEEDIAFVQFEESELDKIEFDSRFDALTTNQIMALEFMIMTTEM